MEYKNPGLHPIEIGNVSEIIFSLGDTNLLFIFIVIK